VFCCSGYCMDMLQRIAKIQNFNFTIHLSIDGLFGSFEKVRFTPQHTPSLSLKTHTQNWDNYGNFDDDI
jgi:hypothetical protein